ncbi:FtsK/SpoIIIE domain-containing protein [Halobacteriovorax sp. HLS]|uniref:FtsK/SpoIIIE domain-containing protein n=1 Tax=Halobacteriovorax sp. HLS TaxID=2234000 RepID=UPI000FD956C6|nr:FtsK/SpoIIIE domain-containing protein [Halobacteriovorax sp. HLS]
MKKDKSNEAAGKLFDALGKLFMIYFDISYYGIKKIKVKSAMTWFYITLALMIIFSLTYNYDFLVILNKILPFAFTDTVIEFFVKLSWVKYFLLFSLGALFLSFPLIGAREYKKIKSYQNDFNFLSLKAGNGTAPKVIRVIEVDDYKTKVFLKSEGIGIDRYQSKVSDLTTALGQIVEDIRPCKNPKFVEFSLTKKSLAEKVSYYEMPESKNSPYTFSIGESLGGFLTQDISTLPHMLIAGTTGGGKSVFFKQTLVSLLKGSNNIQLYLLDLKKGVEMRPFEDLPNVKVIKTEKDAVNVLKNLRNEMDRRFDYLEENKLKEISPKRDKMDKIIIGVDEASVLYTKVKSDSAKKKYITEARELTDELSKLSRAAGIHLILATQKVTKETIDTKVQENIGGRMCFQMNTLQGSMTVLGNKMALNLPDIKGRGIWASGNKFTEIQAPFLSEDELETELALLGKEYESKTKTFFGPMVALEKVEGEKKKVITKASENEKEKKNGSSEDKTNG